MIITALKKHYHLIVLFSVIFALYFMSMPSTMALEDDGIFIMAFYYAGIPHPPGYPLMTLFGYLATHLPIGSPALNSHALSAFFSALSSIVLYLIVARITLDNSRKNLTAYTAALAFTLSSTVWSQSIITEVYTLNAFLFLLTLYLILLIKDNIENNTVIQSQFLLLGLTTGFALSNHWPLYILGSLGLVILFIGQFKYVFKHWALISTGLILGLTPYVWMHFNSSINNIFNFSGPFDNIEETIKFIRREHFNHNGVDFSETANYYDKLSFLLYTLKQLINQWGIFNSLFVPIGIFVAFTKSHPTRNILLAILVSYITTSLVLSQILNYDFTEQRRSDMRPFFVLAHSMGAIFFALGVSFILSISKKYVRKEIILALIVVITLTTNLPKNYRADYLWTDNYSEQMFDIFKPNSILFVSGDITTTTMSYWHYIKKVRPDMTIISEDSILLKETRLYDPVTTNGEQIRNIILNFINTTDRPVYFTQNKYRLGMIFHWLAYEYDKTMEINSILVPPFNPKRAAYLDYVFTDSYHPDKTTNIHRQKLRLAALPYLISHLRNISKGEFRDKYVSYVKKTHTTLRGITFYLIISKYFRYENVISDNSELIKLAKKLALTEESKTIIKKFNDYLKKYPESKSVPKTDE